MPNDEVKNKLKTLTQGQKSDKVEGIAQMERQREQALKGQKQAQRER